MAGSAIAKGEPFKTGVNATRLAIGAFIVPYIFVMNPAMLMIDTTVWAVVQNVATALIGMYALSGGLAGFVQDHCKWYERILLIAGGLGMIIPCRSHRHGLRLLRPQPHKHDVYADGSIDNNDPPAKPGVFLKRAKPYVTSHASCGVGTV